MIDKLGVKCFIHSPYVINLSRSDGSDRKCEKCKKVPDKSCDGCADGILGAWEPVNALKAHLEYGSRLGCKGVVVHLGKKVCYTVERAIDIMRENVEKAAKYATDACPLLLETGAGVEVLSDVEEFAQFYLSLSEETKAVCRVCLDTCHVWASGYLPMVALNIFIEYGVPISLIHYNDSKDALGSRKDRHAPIAQGKIWKNDYRQLMDIADFGIANGIPLVFEF